MCMLQQKVSIPHFHFCSGYGNALYINHPNGYTTLSYMATLFNDFYPELQQYLERQQYARKKLNIDLTLQPDSFCKEGRFHIAYSGTT